MPVFFFVIAWAPVRRVLLIGTTRQSMECLCLDESSCLRLASSLSPLHHLRVFVLPPPLFPCTFLRLLLAVAPVSPHLRLCLPLHLLRTFPRCLLIFLASSFFLPSHPPPLRIFPLRFPMPSPCRLYIYPCVLSSSLSLALREQLFATTRGFSPDRNSFCLVSVRGFVEVRALLLRQAGEGCLPLLGIKSIYIGGNAIFCKKCIFSMKKIGKCLQIQKKSLPLHPHLRNNGSYKV